MALRHANDGWAITVWSDIGDVSGKKIPGWKLWRTLDAKYAEKDPGWLMTISGDEIAPELLELIRTGHPMTNIKAGK